MTTKTVTELPEATSAAEVDYLLVAVGGVTKKLAISSLFSGRNRLELNASLSGMPTAGTVRVATGGLDGNGFQNYMGGQRPSSPSTPTNVGIGYGFARTNVGGTAQNVLGLFGSWADGDDGQPDIVEGYFNTALSFAYSNPTPQGDYSGWHLDSWKGVASPVSGWVEAGGFVQRRAFMVERYTNFIFCGQRDHVANPEDALGFGEGVAYWGWAEVAPTTSPTQGVTWWCGLSDSKLYYRRPNGNVVCVDNHAGQVGLDLPVTGTTTLDATQAENAAIIVAADAPAPSGPFDLVLPNTKWKRYELHNTTAQTMTAKRAGGVGVIIPAGKSAIVRHTGSDYSPVGAVSP